MHLERAQRFVVSNTILARPPLVPEIELYLATEITPLWKATSDELADVDPLPFWAFAWAGGQALARYVIDNNVLVKDKLVLDFASGSGLCGISAALSGAKHVIAADIDPFFMAALSLNARHNNVVINATSDDLIGNELAVDVVLAGDIFYEREMADSAMAWFRCLAGRGITVLVGDPCRTYMPRLGLQLEATYLVPTSRELEDQDSRITRVSRVLP